MWESGMRVPGFRTKPRETETMHPKGLLPGVVLQLKSALC